MIIEEIRARGHRLITARHRSTFEITTEDYLTERGECIIGVSADKAAYDLSPGAKNALKKGSKVFVVLEAMGIKDTLWGYGSPLLNFRSRVSIVFRKSSYVDERTVIVNASKAAKDLRKDLIHVLKDPKVFLNVYLFIINTSNLNK